MHINRLEKDRESTHGFRTASIDKRNMPRQDVIPAPFYDNYSFAHLILYPSPQLEDQETMLSQQSEQLKTLHEEKRHAQHSIESFQTRVADLDNNVSRFCC